MPIRMFTRFFEWIMHNYVKVHCAKNTAPTGMFPRLLNRLHTTHLDVSGSIVWLRTQSINLASF